jgi:hypothetical protein
MKKLVLLTLLLICAITIFAQTAKTNKQLLQGKWNSVVCKKCYFIFKKNMVTSYDGNFAEIQQFQIGDTNPNIDEESPNDNGEYITFGDTCFHIEKLTATTLQVTTIRGDIFTYKKTK